MYGTEETVTALKLDYAVVEIHDKIINIIRYAHIKYTQFVFYKNNQENTS